MAKLRARQLGEDDEERRTVVKRMNGNFAKAVEFLEKVGRVVSWGRLLHFLAKMIVC